MKELVDIVISILNQCIELQGLSCDGHDLSLEPLDNLGRQGDGGVPGPVDLRVHGAHLAVDVEVLHLAGHVGLEVGGVVPGGAVPVLRGSGRVAGGECGSHWLF